MPGRSRQSRAKGLGRAILETLPIVKFGDPEPGKPGGDIEMEGGNHAAPQIVAEEHSKDVSESETKSPRTSTAPQESGIGPDIQPAASISGQSTAESAEENLGCSICTEDFLRGEDVRVLPCNHKYHPACIDPWLLNVSGTCPLWQATPSALHSTPANSI